jgi:hypothetical protein
MTHKQKLITYLIALVCSWLFTWVVGLLMIMIFADFNGDIPEKEETL